MGKKLLGYQLGYEGLFLPQAPIYTEEKIKAPIYDRQKKILIPGTEARIHRIESFNVYYEPILERNGKVVLSSTDKELEADTQAFVPYPMHVDFNNLLQLSIDPNKKFFNYEPTQFAIELSRRGYTTTFKPRSWSIEVDSNVSVPLKISAEDWKHMFQTNFDALNNLNNSPAKNANFKARAIYTYD